MNLPKLDDLINEQMVVYDHPPDKHLFVAGPPGSGKTSLAVLRAKFLNDLGQPVVLVTRNRMLAALARQLSDGELDTRTMNNFLATTFYEDHSRYVPQVGSYIYDWPSILSVYAQSGRRRRPRHLVIDEAQNLPAAFLGWARRYAAQTLTVFADEDQTTDPLRSSLRDICEAGLPQGCATLAIM